MQLKRLVSMCAVAAAVTLTAASNAATTATPPTFAASAVDAFNPGRVAIGDVNGDGIPDLAAIGPSQSGAVSVLLGNGDGSFLPKSEYSAGQHSLSVAIGDLIGDPGADLAVTNYFSNTVSVLPGPLPAQGLPGFPEAVPGTRTFATGSLPNAVAIADLNADTRLDLVVANEDSDSVSVLIADVPAPPSQIRDFLPHVEYGTGSTPSSVAISDLNGDTNLDLVVANGTSDASPTVSVLIGNGDGSFQPNVETPLDTTGEARTAFSVAIGDLNNDGVSDLAVAHRSGVSVLLGNGDGTFQNGPNWALGTQSESVDIGDLNLDGHADLVVGRNSPVADHLSVLLGRGDGTFPTQTDYPIGGLSGSVVTATIGDLNLDGRPDIVTAPDALWVLLNTSGPSTPQGSNIVVVPADATTGGTPITITFASVNAAGETTVVSSATGPPPPKGFLVRGVYYELATTALFDSAEVCFEYGSQPPPTIWHYENGAWVPVMTTRDTGQAVCGVVTAFSPFALLDPAPVGDQDAPVIACGSADGAWHDANVSIACTASDSGSGLANANDADFLLMTSVPDGTEDADAATESRQVCDLAGNCAPAGPIGGNKVDRRDPTLVLPGALTVDATSPAGAVVNYSVSATDGANLTPNVSCAPATGTAFAVGTTTVTCTATDHVGNSSTGSFAVTVRGAKTQLARLVDSVVNASGLPPVLKTQLIAKLQALAANFDPANAKQKQAVCVALNVFKGVVQSFSGRGIPPAQAAAWIADANRIRAVLGC